MARMRMKRALKALALVAVVALAMLVGAVAWRASHLVVAEGELASGAPALSEWSYFGEFWEESDFLTASYAERSADGEDAAVGNLLVVAGVCSAVVALGAIATALAIRRGRGAVDGVVEAGGIDED